MKTTNDLCGVRDSRANLIHAVSCEALAVATNGSLVVIAHWKSHCIVSMQTAGDGNNSPLIVS